MMYAVNLGITVSVDSFLSWKHLENITQAGCGCKD